MPLTGRGWASTRHADPNHRRVCCAFFFILILSMRMEDSVPTYGRTPRGTDAENITADQLFSGVTLFPHGYFVHGWAYDLVHRMRSENLALENLEPNLEDQNLSPGPEVPGMPFA